jgi:hypothetical protein
MMFNPDPKFPWKIEQVEAVASIFFDKAPERTSTSDKWAWAAREAVNYLNARRNACNRALERDKAISDQYERVNALVKEREKLPAEWPYEKAVKYITGENVWDRALKKLKQFALHLSKGDPEQAERDLDRFRGQVIKRSDVTDLRSQFVGFWEHHIKTQKRVSGKKGGRKKRVEP